EDDGVDLADVGIDSVAEQQHLQQRDDQREKKCAKVAPNVKSFLVEDGAKSSEDVTHVWPPWLRAPPLDCWNWPGSGMSARQKRLGGWGRGGDFLRPPRRFGKAAGEGPRGRDDRRSAREWIGRKLSRCGLL